MPELVVLDYPFRSDVEALFNAVRDLPNPVWFDSGKPRSLQGRLDIISAAPARILETRGSSTLISDNEGNSQSSSDCPFALCQEAMDDFALKGDKLTELPFVGGLAGFFGYGLGNHNLASHKDGKASSTLRDGATGPTNMPDMRQSYYLWALVINQQISQAHLVFHPACPARLRRDIQARLASPAPIADSPFRLRGAFKASTSRHEYQEAVARVKSYIAAGTATKLTTPSISLPNLRVSPGPPICICAKPCPHPLALF